MQIIFAHGNNFCVTPATKKKTLHELVKKYEHKAELHLCRDCWGLLSLRRLLLRTVREKRRKVISRYPTFALAQVKPADSTACLESRNYWS